MSEDGGNRAWIWEVWRLVKRRDSQGWWGWERDERLGEVVCDNGHALYRRTGRVMITAAARGRPWPIGGNGA